MVGYGPTWCRSLVSRTGGQRGGKDNQWVNRGDVLIPSIRAGWLAVSSA